MFPGHREPAGGAALFNLTRLNPGGKCRLRSIDPAGSGPLTQVVSAVVIPRKVPAKFVPAAAVTRKGRALLVSIGRKASVGGLMN